MRNAGAKALSVAMAAAVALMPVATRAQASGPVNTDVIPITGTTADGQDFTANFTIQRFEEIRNQIVAVGVLSDATLDGAPWAAVTGQAIAVPVTVKGDKVGSPQGGFGANSLGLQAVPASYQGPGQGLAAQSPMFVPVVTCTILHLTLGPLDIDLLGLLIHLDRVVLTIDAQQGGGLLGDLLCGVANLLNGLNLVGLLNDILAILQQL